jgi:hypothetical protein
MGKVLDIIGEGSLTISDKCLQLYGFLTGSETFNAERQLSILKTIRSNLGGLGGLGDITFDGKQISQLIMTPDSKTFQDTIEEYIVIGDKLSLEEKLLKNQRLSIYGLDQILLKLMCLNEKTPSGQNLKGWYVESGAQSVWTEIVNKRKVSDMGEIALFNCRDLIECKRAEKEQELEPEPESEYDKASGLKSKFKKKHERTKKRKYTKEIPKHTKKHRRTRKHKR